MKAGAAKQPPGPKTRKLEEILGRPRGASQYLRTPGRKDDEVFAYFAV
jgi:hypothetical protein